VLVLLSIVALVTGVRFGFFFFFFIRFFSLIRSFREFILLVLCFLYVHSCSFILYRARIRSGSKIICFCLKTIVLQGFEYRLLGIFLSPLFLSIFFSWARAGMGVHCFFFVSCNTYLNLVGRWLSVPFFL
jgi:hypothetical protein